MQITHISNNFLRSNRKDYNLKCKNLDKKMLY